MTNKSNDPFQFWEELKRRRVIRVITVYAAAAFVILEVISIIVEPLKLPEWTLPLVIILLSIGFILSIIFSWVYDITPEGIEITKPSSHKKSSKKQPASKGWKITTYASAFIIIGFVIFYVVGNNKKSIYISNLKKSIAVIPFENWSQSEEYSYMGDAIANEIITQLYKIKEFYIPAFTSTSEYKGTDKPSIPQIGKELNVNFVIGGTVERQEDEVSIHVWVIQADIGNTIWANEFNGKWKNIFTIRADIAKNIAQELETLLSPEEIEQIENRPTLSLNAYDFYLEGHEEHVKFWLDNKNREALKKAEGLYLEALEHDSTFARAYAGLAFAYWDKNFWRDYFSDSFMDSVLILTEKAFNYDSQLSDVYNLRGRYYRQKGEIKLAISEYDKAIKINPNDWLAYWSKGILYSNFDGVKTLENLHKAADLNRGPQLQNIYSTMSFIYGLAGIRKWFTYYSEETLKLNGDSSSYCSRLALYENYQGNFMKAVEYGKKGFEIDSSNLEVIDRLAYNYMFLGMFDEALTFYEKYLNKMDTLKDLNINDQHRIAYTYWMVGNQKKADFYFNQQVEYCLKSIELNRPSAKAFLDYYDLAAVYAFRGEKEKAYENLNVFNEKPIMPFWMNTLIKQDPLFDPIRHEPEFQKIVREVEAKYKAEHERVKAWLEENNKL